MKRFAIIALMMACTWQAGAQNSTTLEGVAKLLKGFISAQAATQEDTASVRMLGRALDALAEGDLDGVLSQAKEAAGLNGRTPADMDLPAGTDRKFISAWNPRKFFLNLPAANYSGITALSVSGLEGDFLLIDDKSDTEGFRKVHLTFDADGQITALRDDGFVRASTGAKAIDGEGIAYDPRRGTVLMTREATNEILEFSTDGRATGKSLKTKKFFPVNGNAGLESLSCNAATGEVWTMPENASDGDLRIQRYSPSLRPDGNWNYRLDIPAVKDKGAIYVFGVSEICAMEDGSLLVLEREANIPGTSVTEAAGAGVRCKLYRVDPSSAKKGSVLKKHLLLDFKTYAVDLSFANYEGMCLGPVLPDGRRVLVLIADSQKGYKGVLRDWMQTIVLN